MSVTSWSRGLLGVLLVGGIATMLSGCVGLFGTDTGPVPWDSPPPGDALPPANPVRVTPVLDTTRAKTVTVGASGGTASVTGEDGTVFTLTVPQGALLEDADITLTPLTDIPDLPTEGGFVAGVDLQPDGLRFATPAELVMDLGSGLDTSDLTPALITGADHEFGLVPAEVDGRTVTFSLPHFTDPTAGAGGATGSPVPSSVEGRAMTAISKDLAQGIKLNTAYAQILEQWYDRGVKAKIDGATSNQNLIDAILSFHAWLSEIRGLGLGDKEAVSGLPAILHGRIADGASRYRKRVDGVVRASVKLCKQNADPKEGWDVTFWPVLVNDLYLVGGEEAGFPGSISRPDVQPWADLISSCLHFVGYYTHLIKIVDDSKLSFQAIASATPELQVVLQNDSWQLQWKDAADEIASFAFSTNECRRRSWSSVSSTFHIVSTHHALRHTRLLGGVELDPNMTVTFDPGDPKVTATVVCADGTTGSLNAQTEDFWRLGFATLRTGAGDLPTQATLKAWTMPYGAYVAHAHLGAKTADGFFWEDGDLDIAHEPL